MKYSNYKTDEQREHERKEERRRTRRPANHLREQVAEGLELYRELKKDK